MTTAQEMRVIREILSGRPAQMSLSLRSAGYVEVLDLSHKYKAVQ